MKDKIVYRRNKDTKESRIIKENISNGFGNVIISPDIDRDIYITNFYQSGYLNIVTDFNVVIKDVLCPQHLRGKIIFPEEINQKGSLLSWQKIDLSDNYIITGFYERNYDFNLENIDKDVIKNDTKNISIIKQLNNYASLILNVIDNLNEGSVIKLLAKSNLNISSLEINNDGSINLNCSEESNEKIEYLKKIKISSNNKIEKVLEISYIDGLSYYDKEFDSYLKVKEEIVEVENKIIKLGKDAEEPMVLGNTINELIISLIDAILSLTVPTGTGPSGTPINTSQFSAIKTKLQNEIILSKKNYVE